MADRQTRSNKEGVEKKAQKREHEAEEKERKKLTREKETFKQMMDRNEEVEKGRRTQVNVRWKSQRSEEEGQGGGGGLKLRKPVKNAKF